STDVSRCATSSSLFFFFYCSAALPPLHSFPTRRSSDLRLTRVVAVVAFAGQDDDQIAGASQLFGARGDNVADTTDDLCRRALGRDRKSTRLNSSHLGISYAVFCLKKKKKKKS